MSSESDKEIWLSYVLRLNLQMRNICLPPSLGKEPDMNTETLNMKESIQY